MCISIAKGEKYQPAPPTSFYFSGKTDDLTSTNEDERYTAVVSVFFVKLLNRLTGEEGNEGKEPEKAVQSYRIPIMFIY